MKHLITLIVLGASCAPVPAQSPWSAKLGWDISTHKAVSVASFRLTTETVHLGKIEGLTFSTIAFSGVEYSATSSQALTGGMGGELAYSIDPRSEACLWAGQAVVGKSQPHWLIGAGLSYKF